MISKIADKVLEKRWERESEPNFETKASAVRKLKGKENWESEHREKANFMYNFVQKANATFFILYIYKIQTPVTRGWILE